jgi:hypothetical protein
MLRLGNIKWSVESIRVTFFTTDKIEFLQKKWFESVAGTAPTSSVHGEKGRVSHHQENIEMISLANEDFRLDLSCRGNRIDWNASPLTDEPVFCYEKLAAVSDFLIDKIKVWQSSFLKDNNQVVRLAFAVNLTKEVDSEKEGVVFLKKIIPFFGVSENTYSDIDLKLSRLRSAENFKWNDTAVVSVKEIIQLGMNEDSFFSIPTPIEKCFFFFRLDANTIADNKEAFKDVGIVLKELKQGVYRNLIEGLTND